MLKGEGGPLISLKFCRLIEQGGKKKILKKQSALLKNIKEKEYIKVLQKWLHLRAFAKHLPPCQMRINLKVGDKKSILAIYLAADCFREAQ